VRLHNTTGWKIRQRRGHYYTRSRKVNGGIILEYVGTGLDSVLAAQHDGEERAQRLAERNQFGQDDTRWGSTITPLT
jgi:hypothetical protein